jgi:hypothetical protein
MQDKIVVERDALAFANVAVAVGQSPAVWNVPTLDVQTLGSVVAGMKPDGNAHFAEPPRYLALGMIEQAGTDPLPLKPRQHIEVLNLRMAHSIEPG